MPKTRGEWFQLLAAVGYIGLSLALYFVLEPLLHDPEATAQQIRAAGILGPMVYVVLYSVQIFIPFLPGVTTDLVSGALWGFGGTLLLSQFSAALAGATLIWIVRRLGLQTIDQRFPSLLRGPWRFVRLVERWPWTLAIVSTLVGDVAYFVAGATRVKTWQALLVLGLARLPAITIYSNLGWAIQNGLVSQVAADQFNTLIPLVSIVTISGLLIGVVILSRYGKQIVDRLEKRLGENGGEPPAPSGDGSASAGTYAPVAESRAKIDSGESEPAQPELSQRAGS